MVDVHTPEQRRANMRAIRHKDTDPEMQIRRLLFARGFRFRLHVSSLPGAPDIVLPKHRVAIFVHGCFWHGHSCHLFKVPSTRTEFWMGKIQGTRDRDLRAESNLRAEGWRILTIWECALKGKARRLTSDIGEQVAAWILAPDIKKPHLNIEHQSAESAQRSPVSQNSE